MLLSLLVLAIVGPLQGGATSDMAGLSPATSAIIAPVHKAYMEAEERQAGLPPSASPKDELVRLYDLDQAGRRADETINYQALPESQRYLANRVVAREILEHDLENQRALKRLLPKEGWFTLQEYGVEASRDAFLIVQHAENDPEFMRTTLDSMGRLLATGEVDGRAYALLYDRIATDFDHRPQRYGSQVSCVQGKWVPKTVEDPAKLDERRRSIGLKESEASYLLRFVNRPCS